MFHKLAGIVYVAPPDHPKGVQDVTVCGRVLSAGTPCLPTKHAVKFARPCKGCFA